ncbi:MAG: ATP-grasp domain-containing protein [Parcubacteria group bacterium]
MDLTEAQGKKLFSEYRLPVPRAYEARNVTAAVRLAKKFPRAVLKAQIPAGHRKKLGGIVMVTPITVRERAKRLFGKSIVGYPVSSLLVEEFVDLAKEWYLALTIDRTQRQVVLLFSRHGGIDVEQLAKTGTLVRMPLPLTAASWDKFLRQAGLRNQATVTQLKRIIRRLIKLMYQSDALLVEVNPLVLTTSGKLLLLDSKVTIDDAALFRQARIKVAAFKEPDSRVVVAQKAGMSYVPLLGNIAVIGNGAGLVMATLDALTDRKAHPANFLDVGGGADRVRMTKALQIVLSQPGVRKILINIFGGITRTDEIALGIVRYKRTHRLKIPMVVRLVGNREIEAQQILKRAGIRAYYEMQEAIKAVSR